MNLKQTAKRALRAAGFYRRRLQLNPYPGVAVLAYHGVRGDSARRAMCFENLHVTAAQLDAHCACLRALDCTPLSMADWQQIARGARPVPPRAVLVTFDDGYRSVLTEGLPVLERYGIPAVVFVTTGPVERQVRFWFDAVAGHYGEEAVERAKQLDHSEWQQLSSTCETRVTDDDPHAPLAVDELRRLASHRLMTIGGHTVSHPILARAPAHVQRSEILDSRAMLQRWLGAPITAFAYPNGRPSIDFTEATSALVGAVGYADAFTTYAGFAEPGSTPFAYPRFVMLDSVSASELAHRLAASWPREEAVVSCPVA